MFKSFNQRELFAVGLHDNIAAVEDVVEVEVFEVEDVGEREGEQGEHDEENEGGCGYDNDVDSDIDCLDRGFSA